MRGFAQRLGFAHQRDPDDNDLVRYSVGVDAGTGDNGNFGADSVARSTR
jgi:hypothetical protein